jgi:hypothetical protein
MSTCFYCLLTNAVDYDGDDYLLVTAGHRKHFRAAVRNKCLSSLINTALFKDFLTSFSSTIEMP